jgi:DtxR family Mn-dependent transcriptional regulator
MHREDPVSVTHQMYLKALFRLCRTHPVGRVRDLAEELGVTPGTVSTALNRLRDLGLVEREHYGGALLTPTGTAIAECVLRRFETLRTLLVEVFGVAEDDAESDACLMEHAISPATLNRISKFLELIQSGESFNLESLQHLHGQGTDMCAGCEAVGFCQAAEAAAHN